MSVTPPTKGVGLKMYIFSISVRNSITLYGLSLDSIGFFQNADTLFSLQRTHLRLRLQQLQRDFWSLDRPSYGTSDTSFEPSFNALSYDRKNRAPIEAPKKFSQFSEKFHEILVRRFLISLHGDEVEQI